MKALWLVLLLTGCAVPHAHFSGADEVPTPFEAGQPTPPPWGCQEGRLRGVDC